MVSRNITRTGTGNLLLLFYIVSCSLQTFTVTPASAFQHGAVTVPSRRFKVNLNLKYDSVRTRSSLFSSSYGRNAEIWPPTNGGPIKLADSFPNGELPESVISALQQELVGQKETTIKTVEWRKRLPRAMARILKRAASAQEEEAFSEDVSGLDKTPAVLAMILLLSGYVRPLDVLLVSFLTGYFLILGMVARSLRVDNVTPVLPALPPQGHVPTLVSNPLGYTFTNSRQYDLFLKCGVLVGLLAPILACLRYTLEHQTVAARACARPIFFLCFQALSEAVSRSRRVMTPLPIRILIPVAYNAVRLGYLWNWSFCPANLGWVGRSLALANLMYWALNLFGFLLPVAAMRYMRAHFYCVEAEQVITRAGMEESIGLSA
jgi:hypothetical protein